MKIKILRDGVKLPIRADEGAAGYDLCSAVDTELHPGDVLKVPTGLAMEIQNGWTGIVCARSGLGTQGLVLANQVGVIDSSYRGEVLVALRNRTYDRKFKIEKGQRIAQIVFMPCWMDGLMEVDELSETDRDEGGFGSTG